MQATTQSESSSAEKRPLSKRGKKNLAREEKEAEVEIEVGGKREEGERSVGGGDRNVGDGGEESEDSGAMFEGYREKRAIDDGDNEEEDEARDEVGDGHGDK
ncbi:hypothetical protein BPAE_0198g00030 [Botrytis paeoniae]|uniref:Uncharacterized protein n=1 Tax=Botrytis paeoniae TaxID=278948 RepID=A0A4Z1FJC7_9HELO|nr:hypothetical protein BPAE_0198g00030 [Botrytis paeoniae]